MFSTESEHCEPDPSHDYAVNEIRRLEQELKSYKEEIARRVRYEADLLRDIAGKQAVIEASKAAINGQVNDCLAVEDSFAAFRQTVADALDALRAELNCQQRNRKTARFTDGA